MGCGGAGGLGGAGGFGAGGFGVDPPPPGLGEVPVGGFGGAGGAGGFGGGGLPGSSFQSPPVVTSGIVPEPPGVTLAVTTGAPVFRKKTRSRFRPITTLSR
ncbi:hypothetical protein CCB80_04055 [Armatimonadetes bacterium Uphvl-Ar1]|nr:hypothetical protein CCB80_04055 [Armatimonadetes bacterium Uphvl-Ar1]